MCRNLLLRAGNRTKCQQSRHSPATLADGWIIMPKWLIIIATSALAGFFGFACGSLLTRPDRQKIQSTQEQAQKLKSENAALRVNISSMGVEPEDALPPSDLPIWEMNKKQFLGFCASRSFIPDPSKYRNNLNVTFFQTEGDYTFRVFWIPVIDKLYIKQILICRTDIEDSLENAEPVLLAWKRILPEIVPLFIKLKKETNSYVLDSKIKRFRDTDYVYWYAKNNKYVLFYKPFDDEK